MIFIPNAVNVRYTYGRIAQIIHGLPLAELEPGRHTEAPEDPKTYRRLERVSKVALLAYNQAIGDCAPKDLQLTLDFIEPELRGFAYEGAGLGLMILDICTPWGGSRTFQFLEETGARPELVYIGAGQALAALFRPLAPTLSRIAPAHHGFLIDGYGFRNAFFFPGRTLGKAVIPGAISAEMLPDFDVGAGRALWFLHGTRPEGIAAAIAGLTEPRRRWLWAGVGFASTYAGGVDRAVLENLREIGDADGLALGCVAAAMLRQDRGNSTHRDVLACDVYCGVPPESLAGQRPATSPEDTWAERAERLAAARSEQGAC
ncbi:MAG: hypothetical protein ACI8S6_001007 [Myxococcota bacterium]|jgi:hypothetical protein